MKFTLRKMRAYRTIVFLLLVAGTGLFHNLGAIQDEPPLLNTSFTFVPSWIFHKTVYGEPHPANKSCTVLTISSGKKILLGGNADTSTYGYRGATPYLFFFPHRDKDYKTENSYGYAVLGWEWRKNTRSSRLFVSGINEKGLAFGSSGLPPVALNPHPERPYSASSTRFEIKALRECSSVTCVIKMAEKFNWGSTSDLLSQYHFADSTGNAVVISAGKDGELAFTEKEKEFLVSTNFNRANPDNGKYPCWRYDTAVSMLQKDEQENDVDYITQILDAVHVEGALLNTEFSYIFDLGTGDVYIYYFHQFDEAIQINLAEWLSSDQLSRHDSLISHGEYLPNLFSQETREKAVFEFHRYRNQFIVFILIFFTVIGFLSFFIYKKTFQKIHK